MAKNKREITQDASDYLFWLLLLQGLSSLLLGILVIFYPVVVFVLVAVEFIWSGITALVMAARVKRFGKEVVAAV